MSIDSALILRRDRLPSAAELTAALAETGVSVTFPKDFALAPSTPGWIEVVVDGDKTGFDLAASPVAELESALRSRAQAFGDLVLSFGARGSLSAETVLLMQLVIGRRWRAALLIEDELAEPEREWGLDAPLDDLHRDRYGALAQRAAALDARIGAAEGGLATAGAPRAATRFPAGWIVIPVVLGLAGYLMWDVLT